MMKTTKIEGGLLPAVIRLVDSFLTDDDTMRKRKEKQMPKNLFKEFEDWFSYNFPGTKLTKLREKVLRITLEGELLRTDKELTAKLRRLLPKSKPKKKPLPKVRK